MKISTRIEEFFTVKEPLSDIGKFPDGSPGVTFILLDFIFFS